ncbi:unnamed protein product [Allacma fusca]|uniref:Uncharacterized protein n=1 Tax=Allacma fusca TaxID=39272 RepID=A0A8J2KUY8_9HEXA|nr:unnamed protein product [Allacma fusca]
MGEEVDNLNYTYLIKHGAALHKKIDQELLNEDVKDILMTESPSYVTLKTHALPEKFYEWKRSWSLTKFIQNFRFDKPRIWTNNKVTNLNAIWTKWKRKDKERKTTLASPVLNVHADGHSDEESFPSIENILQGTNLFTDESYNAPASNYRGNELFEMRKENQRFFKVVLNKLCTIERILLS